ncbi:hypothetical protein ACHAXA_001673 [Cyclostephanos tholiformis]|uniref:DUF4042 domain-containing protein n=1 Tax=Cyclostephanos tholiformis TaxID=382380 RepID=A0ABD3RS60_9STRA
MRQQIVSQTSRWASLRRDDEPGGSSSSTAPYFSSSQRRLQSRGRCKSNTSCNGHNRGWGNEKQNRSHRILSDNSVGDNFNWRRRAANDARNPPPKEWEKEEAVRTAIEILKYSTSHFMDKTQTSTDKGASEERLSCVLRSVEDLAASIFHDAVHFFELPRSLHRLDSTKPLPEISNVFVWETGYSLIRLIHLLSQSQSDCCEIIRCMSSVALGCLQSLTNNQQHQQQKQLGADQSSASKYMTDTCLCECASMLLDSLRFKRRHSFFDRRDTENDDEMMLCKATLFSCLGKILTLSTMTINTCAYLSNHKNGRNRLDPLSSWGAEKTANMIVKTALPFLEILTKDDGTAISFSDKYNYGHGIMECLYLLFRDPSWGFSYENIDLDHPAHLSRHAAAIFAPLIVDVMPDGKENQHVNPLRKRTLSAICSFWELSYELIQKDERSSDERVDQTMVIVMSCRCLAAALNALSALRKSRTQTNHDVPNEIDVFATARQLQSMIQNEELQHLQPKFISLLTFLGLAYPSASASHWYLFLEPSAKKSSLLSILDEGAAALGSDDFHGERCIALPSTLRATSILLTAMPFTLWISGEARPSLRTSGGNFSSRVRSALLNVVNCIYNLMTAIKGIVCCERESIESMLRHAPSVDIVIVLVSEVAEKLCTKLPFSGENHILLRPTSLLVQCAGDIYVQAAKSLASKRLPSKAKLEHTLLINTLATFSHVIMESLGAVTSDSNAEQVTSRFAPAIKWLSDASSFEFIGLLLTESCWPCPSASERMYMLSAVAKRSPLTLVREPFNLASFCDVCVDHSQSRDESSRILGVKLIESFIMGRKTCVVECTTKSSVFSVISQTFCPLLLVALEDHSSAVRIAAATSLGSLVGFEWIGLFLLDAENLNASSIDWTPLESILRLCTANVEKVANVRASCCKAIGDISASCIHRTLFESEDNTNCAGPLADKFIIAFSGKVSEVMTIALSDDVAIVRSMALFAIGNIALALKEYNNETLLPSVPITRRLFRSVCECVDDDDEKVAANAIRSISHTSYFIYHPKYYPNLENSDSTLSIDLFRSLVAKLSAKINFALDDAIGESPRGLTWKQRTWAKKQSWGSCVTLGTMLHFSNILPNIDYSLLESALSSLFRCIQLSNFINEKILAAAINALLGLPSSLWDYLSCQSDCIGRGLATYFGYLDENNVKTSYHHHDVESLVDSLLARASAVDFRRLFLIRDSVPFSVEFFYRWLVARDVETGILGEIASAVTGVEVANILEVSVAQMFVSRAIQRHQRRDTPYEGINPGITEGVEEGDEL